ncbi:DsrE/DsrF/TusD sulfur relay family protein [Fischerella sp. PCC 9605]|uniref:DsrE/DsrF/TusD sulfur relay family protein n=1 Tax=Fischerella sp. PCC 9605 TaxID=1173024 RepID=UPI00047A17B0|nr:DsrE family protein [Fischerella sp. PCC 9605]
MKILFIINDAPYGTEKAYNALRMAMSLQKEHPTTEVLIFLLADAVTCALPDQSTPQGYYNIERMLKAILNKGGKVKTCGTCAEARGIKQITFIDGIENGTMSQLTQWTVDADKVLTF